MAGEISIRRATSRDLDQLLVLGSEYAADDGHGSEYAADDGHGSDIAVARRGFEPLLESDDLGVILVAETAEEFIGHAVVTWGWSIEIGGLDVDLVEIHIRRRGRGLGGRLLGELETACRARDVKRISLETERPNDAARRPYARHGWTEADSIWMSKELT